MIWYVIVGIVIYMIAVEIRIMLIDDKIEVIKNAIGDILKGVDENFEKHSKNLQTLNLAMLALLEEKITPSSKEIIAKILNDKKEKKDEQSN